MNGAISPPIFSSCLETKGEFSHSLALKHFARIRELSNAEKPALEEWLRNSDRPDREQRNRRVRPRHSQCVMVPVKARHFLCDGLEAVDRACYVTIWVKEAFPVLFWSPFLVRLILLYSSCLCFPSSENVCHTQNTFTYSWLRLAFPVYSNPCVSHCLSQVIVLPGVPTP